MLNGLGFITPHPFCPLLVERRRCTHVLQTGHERMDKGSSPHEEGGASQESKRRFLNHEAAGFSS